MSRKKTTTEGIEVLFVQEEFINVTEGYRCGDGGVYEAYTADIGKLFRSMQKEHGRCTGKVYIDRLDEEARQVGWTFEKRVPYSDVRTKEDTYLQEAWVTVMIEPPTKTVEYHYANL